MDRPSYSRPPEQGQYHQTATPPYMPQVPFDPFQANRDPFLPGGDRRGSAGLPPRAWPSSQGNISIHHSPLEHSAQHQKHPPSAASMSMRPPYDDRDRSRRGSLGHAAGSPQYAGRPPPPPPSYPARNMPPPSSPQSAPSSAHLTSAPRGPPTASPFPGIRDLASSSHRPGMSISAILGGSEERRPPDSPHGPALGPSPTTRLMQPPSPGRARSSSMRESSDRGLRRATPPRPFGEPLRMGSEPRRDGIFGSPQFRREPAHSFRAYQQQMLDHPQPPNGSGAPVRPSSQPAEADRLRGLEEAAHRESLFGNRVPGFRHMGGSPVPARSEPPLRHERPQLHSGVTSHPQDRTMFNGTHMEGNRATPGPGRYAPVGGTFGASPRDDPNPLFRAGYENTSYSAAEAARESIEGRAHEMRRQHTQHSPPMNDLSAHHRPRGFMDRPVTLEDHQRVETLQKSQQRKESDSSVHKAILNISPELNRRGRNSPLPQAVQGAQPRHIGPGGDNPGIKMEFGRMFSGLGSGVGSTPNPSHPANGVSTPSRLSPASRPFESGDLRRSVEAETQKGTARAGSRLGRRNNGRRSRGDVEETEGRNTPDAQRSNKRSKTSAQNHHHHRVHQHQHHHHHHHLDGTESGNGANFSRNPSNPLPQASFATSQSHHHHHHHPHAVGHHHHHPPRSTVVARKPTLTISSERVLDEVASKPRKHLGTHLYTTELDPAPAVDTLADAKIRYSSKMQPIPVFMNQENCTYTIRVPRYYLTPGEGGAHMSHTLEGICKSRQLWGTEIYTDDSDVIAAAIHSGWLKGDFGEYNHDIHEICDNASEHGNDDGTSLSLAIRPQRPIKAPEGYDAHVTVLLLPPLESYAATSQHHLTSREWKKKHDGMSYMIHNIEFVDEGPSSRFVQRTAAARKTRIAVEEAARKEAAAGLLLFASGGYGTVRVGA